MAYLELSPLHPDWTQALLLCPVALKRRGCRQTATHSNTHLCSVQDGSELRPGKRKRADLLLQLLTCPGQRALLWLDQLLHTHDKHTHTHCEHMAKTHCEHMAKTHGKNAGTRTLSNMCVCLLCRCMLRQDARTPPVQEQWQRVDGKWCWQTVVWWRHAPNYRLPGYQGGPKLRACLGDPLKALPGDLRLATASRTDGHASHQQDK